MGLLAARHAVVQSLLARGPQREDRLRQAVLELAGRDRLDGADTAILPGLAAALLGGRAAPLLPPSSCSTDGCGASLADAAFADFVGGLGRDLAAVECELHAAAHQADGGRLYYGVVNRVADGPAMLGTRLSHVQIAFFRSIQHLALPRGAEAAEACAEQVEAVAAEPDATGHIPRLAALTLQLDLPCDPAEASQQPAASATPGAAAATAPHQELTVGERERLLDEL
eukprot:SM006051S19311  [mRNA]  locus=s6051:29:858:- [translate_table: standard]